MIHSFGKNGECQYLDHTVVPPVTCKRWLLAGSAKRQSISLSILLPVARIHVLESPYDDISAIVVGYDIGCSPLNERLRYTCQLKLMLVSCKSYLVLSTLNALILIKRTFQIYQSPLFPLFTDEFALIMTYVNPRSVIACGVLFPILGAIAVALRFKMRHARKTDLGADDWLCLPALVGGIYAAVSTSAC